MIQDQDISQAGWKIPAWCKAVSISRAAFYTIHDECKPKLLKIGKSTIITEAPGAWLKRMLSKGDVRTKRPAPADTRPAA